MNAVATKQFGKQVHAAIAAATAATAATAAQEPEHPTITVAKTLAELVGRVRDAYDGADVPSEDVSIHGGTLIEIATECVQSACSQPAADDRLFYRIAACLTGALAHDRENTPAAIMRHRLLEKACNLAEATVLSFGFSEEPCVAVANGIVAGKAVAVSNELAERSSSPTDVDDLSGELIALNGLLDWVIQARDLCDDIRVSADIDPQLHAALKRNDIRFRSAEWRSLDVGSGVAYVLSRQQSLILSIAGASK